MFNLSKLENLFLLTSVQWSYKVVGPVPRKTSTFHRQTDSDSSPRLYYYILYSKANNETLWLASIWNLSPVVFRVFEQLSTFRVWFLTYKNPLWMRYCTRIVINSSNYQIRPIFNLLKSREVNIKKWLFSLLSGKVEGLTWWFLKNDNKHHEFSGNVEYYFVKCLLSMKKYWMKMKA